MAKSRKLPFQRDKDRALRHGFDPKLPLEALVAKGQAIRDLWRQVSEPMRVERRRLRNQFRGITAEEMERLLAGGRGRITQNDLAAAGKAALQAGLDDLDDDDDDDLEDLELGDDDMDADDELLAQLEAEAVAPPATPTPRPTPAPPPVAEEEPPAAPKVWDPYSEETISTDAEMRRLWNWQKASAG
jgi:hypothetical protein